jgi:hypothetical protein
MGDPGSVYRRIRRRPILAGGVSLKKLTKCDGRYGDPRNDWGRRDPVTGWSRAINTNQKEPKMTHLINDETAICALSTDELD